MSGWGPELAWSTLCAANVGAAYYGFPRLGRWKDVRRLHARCRSRRAIVLTFDDGPGPKLTPRVLKVLQAHGARATFFVLGARAGLAPQILDRLRAEGHEVGWHSQDHRNAWKVAPWSGWRDVVRGYRVVEAWLSRSRLYRPPYGKETLLTALAVRTLGARVGWWTRLSGDTHASLPEPESVVEGVRSDGGGVILLHDFDRTEERAEYVLHLTRLLLEFADRESFSVLTLGDLLT